MAVITAAIFATEPPDVVWAVQTRQRRSWAQMQGQEGGPCLTTVG